MVLEPGNQSWGEAVQAANREGLFGRVPVIVIQDSILGRGRAYPEIPEARIFQVNQLDLAIQALNGAIEEVQQRRRRVV